ncbi:MAG: C25 family cysteine peptidase [bacterium]|nr:C25 family cysteine peptidase [bacterium]
MEKVGHPKPSDRVRLLSLITLCLAVGALQSQPSQAFPPGITLISCDRSEAVLELNTPPYTLGTFGADNFNFANLEIPGWGKLLEAAGNPAVPQAGVLIAMPPGASATLSTEILESKSFPLSNQLPTPTLKTDMWGSNPTEHYLPNPVVYQSNALYPSQWANLGEAVWLRSYWAVPLRMTPVRVNPGQGEALMVTRMRLHVKFQGGAQGKFISDPYGDALAQSEILNYSAARSWQGNPVMAAHPASQDWGQYKLLVEKDGIYKITYSDLQAAGIDPTSFDPKTLKIYLKGIQIPIWVEGEDDHVFNPEDFILFWGQFPRGTFTFYYTYSTTSVYWLGWGGTNGIRVASRTAAPVGSVPQAQWFKAFKHIEVDTLYEKFGVAPSTDLVDQWMWLRLDSNYSPDFSYLLNLPHLAIIPNRTYDLKVSLRGYTYNDSTNPDHHVTVRWNNFPAIDAVWNDQEAITPVVTVPASELVPQYNEIIINAPDDLPPDIVANSFYLDYIQVGYWRDYTVDGDTLLFQSPSDLASGQIRYQLPGISSPDVELWNLTRMERLTGFQVAPLNLTFQDSASDTTYYFIAKEAGLLTPQIMPDVNSDWKSPSHGVDYLIITHEDFYDALDPLVQLYQGKGLRVERAKIGDIYDEFSYGMKDPQAIFDFIQYAYYTYAQPHLTYVLLVGDASWDYRNQDPLPYQDYLPTHSFRSYKWGETASDNYFAAVSGTDPSPDCYIGRLPVNNQDEINLLVQKSRLYTETPSGYWKSQVIFSDGAIADSDAVYFDNTTQSLITTFFPPWYNPPRVYSHPSPPYVQYLGSSSDLINYINQGAALINYIGHAGNQMWTTLSQSEIDVLGNGVKMPFVTAYSCFTGIFSNTTGFGEAFIRKPDGGAIAYWSNGGVGYTYSNAFINNYLFQQLFADSVSHPTFGEATTKAKWDYYASHGNVSSVLTTFVLLGDPGSNFVYQTPNASDTLDTNAPQLTLQFPNINFRSGDYINNPVNFNCEAFDSSGLDLTTLSFELDYLSDSQGNPKDSVVAWSWSPDSLSLPAGFTLTTYTDTLGQRLVVGFIDSLSSGEWKFRMTVSDYFLHGPSNLVSYFRVAYNKLILEKPLNYPNPFSEKTSFTFMLSQQADVTIRVYTVSGKQINTITIPAAEVGYNIFEWDGRDAEGDRLSNGVYLYKITARNGDQMVQQVEKLIKMR